ncbi:MAG TPA: ABC transporter ATP-binding protein [Alphaproteobacteria bacterium]|nr:ABC transporter ATP-binding protein [Alphaproteobacteria bacterium]
MTVMLRVDSLTKIYGNGSTEAGGVRGASFGAGAGEFLTLLGPSGCGKTTSLRCIAGLEEPSGGEIEINGRVVYSGARHIRVPTAARDVAMVFQSYAIWPHMTVYENVAFPLEARRLGNAEIRRRVESVLAMVGLSGMADRPAPFLSGGQQQRVALARAVIKDAPVLLLDEPLSNLDAKLREEMRAELRDLQRRIGTTAVYVTHDQEEALALSDRIVIMHAGSVVETGTPRQLYFAPRTSFAARFIGQADLWPCRIAGRGEDVITVEAPWGVVHSRCFPDDLGAALSLMIRPEHVEIAPATAPDGGASLTGTVARVTFSGRLAEYEIEVGGALIRAQGTTARLWEPGSKVRLRLPPDRCVIVNGGGEA